MPRGQADYGAQAVKAVGASVSDIGELAARLGSVMIYDKRGDVRFFDSFEEPVLSWSTDVQDTGSYVRLDSTTARSGSQSVRLHTEDVSPAAAWMIRHFGLTASRKLGIEISNAMSDVYCDLRFEALVWDGAYQYWLGVKLNAETEELFIETGNNVWTKEADTGPLSVGEDLFYNIKLVFDITKAKYMRLMFTGSEYDISDIDIYKETSNYAQRIRVTILSQNHNSYGGDQWIDDFILTQEEP